MGQQWRRSVFFQYFQQQIAVSAFFQCHLRLPVAGKVNGQRYTHALQVRVRLFVNAPVVANPARHNARHPGGAAAGHYQLIFRDRVAKLAGSSI